jgi:Ca-activated chloride channel family protein
MVFFNPEHKTLEGELDFPIPENAVVCGYAYEYEGFMIPASIVEKEQARVAFEKEVRSGGSASLVEHVKGNSFKIRVYPIPSKGTKQVTVSYTNELLSSGSNNIQYNLPIALSGNAKVDIQVDGNPYSLRR